MDLQMGARLNGSFGESFTDVIPSKAFTDNKHNEPIRICRLVISNPRKACLLITRAAKRFEVPDWLTNQIELCWLT